MLYGGKIQSQNQALMHAGGARLAGLSYVANSVAGGSMTPIYGPNDFRERMRQTTPAFSGFARNWISAHVDNEIPMPFHSGLVPDTVLMGTDC